MVDLVQLAARLLCEWVLRVGFEEQLKLFSGGFAIADVVPVNLALGDERGEAVTGAGILLAQEFVLADGVVQKFFVGEEPALLCQQPGDDKDAGVSFGRCRIAVVDGAICIQNLFIVETGTLGRRTGLQCFLQAFCAVKGG
jgi:hypothetical protein